MTSGRSTLSDAIVRGTHEGEPAYAVVEISLTISDRDITRAADRAATLQEATGVKTFAVAIGEHIPEPPRNPRQRHERHPHPDHGVTSLLRRSWGSTNPKIRRGGFHQGRSPLNSCHSVPFQAKNPTDNAISTPMGCQSTTLRSSHSSALPPQHTLVPNPSFWRNTMNPELALDV